MASAGYANFSNVYWARLARVRIVAEVFDKDTGDRSRTYWHAPPEAQQRVLDAFRRAGARMVVADRVPEGPLPDGWLPLGRGYYARWLVEEKPDAVNAR